jgi:hypothetical protein
VFAQLTKVKEDDFNKAISAHATAPSSKKGPIPRYREPGRYLLCYCFASKSNGASDGGTCPNCMEQAQRGLPVDWENCGICQCSCYADYKTSARNAVALEVAMQKEKDTVSRAPTIFAAAVTSSSLSRSSPGKAAFGLGSQMQAAVGIVARYSGSSGGGGSSSSSSSGGGVGDDEYNLAVQLVQNSDEYLAEASRYWDLHQADMHLYPTTYDHGAAILLQFMSVQDLNLPHRRTLQTALGTPTTKIGPSGVEVRSIRALAMSGSAYNSRLHAPPGPHADELRATAAPVSALAEVSAVLVSALAEVSAVPVSALAEVVRTSEYELDNISSLLVRGGESLSASLLPSGAESGFESAGDESIVNNIAQRIIARGQKRLSEGEHGQEDSKKVRKVRRQMTLQTEDTKKELRSLMALGVCSEEALFYFMDNVVD